MPDRKHLTPEEISAIVDGFDPIDWEEVKMLASLPLGGKRWQVGYYKSEAIRADLRSKLMEDFSELLMPEINMMVLRSLTDVRTGKSYTEPAYYEYLK